MDGGNRTEDQLGAADGSYRGNAHIGALLRAARREVGEDLEQVAETLRIRLAYLEAIEGGDFDRLPGHAYAVGFVRAYADHLGLHSDEVVRRFKEESRSPRRDVDLDFPVPTSEGGLPAFTLVLVALILGAASYGAWHYLYKDEQSVAELIPDIPDRLASLLTSSPEDGTPVVNPVDEAATDPAPVPSETAADPDVDAAGETATAANGSAPEVAASSETSQSAAPEEVSGSPGGQSDQLAGVAPGTDGVDTAEAPPTPSEPTVGSGVAEPAGEPDLATSDGGTPVEEPTADAVAGPETPAETDAAATETPVPAPSEPVDAPQVVEAAPEPAVAEPAPTPEAQEVAAVEPAQAEPTPTETASAAETIPEPVADAAEAPAAEAPPAEAAPEPPVVAAPEEPEVAEEPEADPPLRTGVFRSGGQAVGAAAAPPPAPPASQTQAQAPQRQEAFVGAAAPSDVARRSGGSRVVLRAQADSWVQLRQNGSLGFLLS
ncbi:MAG: helix-turn-helix domain-containing protein, partial [Rhodospirillaceae bacterium]